jgi:hypothetical protein
MAVVLCTSGARRSIGQRAKGRLIDGVTVNIDDLTDRFQYLSVNIS